MTPAQIRTAVDNRLATFWPAFQAFQDTYAANHGGQYWQGLRTCSVVPADGVAVPADIGTRAPSYQSPPTPWLAAIRNATIEGALECHCYEGPQGTGYVLFAYVQINSRLFGRAQNNGPETHRTMPWSDITPVAVP